MAGRTWTMAGWGVLLTLGLGCSSGEVTGTGGFGPGPWMLPGTDGDSAPASDDGNETSEQTSAADGTGSATDGGSTSGAATTGPPPPPPGSTGMPGDGTFGEADDGNQGEQPASGWWAHCTQAIGCDAGFACLTTDVGDDGVCTALCNPAGNPAGCGASPGGSATPVCLTVGGQSICALGCEGGLTCPGGMICIAESDDTGPISICI